MLEKEEIVSPNLEELKSHYRSIIKLDERVSHGSS